MKTKDQIVKVSIQVTAEDITRGARGMSDTCMVARAVKRAVRPSLFRKNPDYVGVVPDRTVVGGVRTEHPFRVVDRISRWDDGDNYIQPFQVRVKFNRKDLRPSFIAKNGL